MRPPRRSWQFTVAAHEALYRAIEAVAGSAPSLSGDAVRKLTEAREAIAELKEFVWEQEECEEP